MGRNYYWLNRKQAKEIKKDTLSPLDMAPHYHICKISCPYVPLFHFNTKHNLNSWAKWKDFLKDRTAICDEYGSIISYDDFVALIEDRMRPESGWEQTFEKAASEKDRLTGAWRDDYFTAIDGAVFTHCNDWS